MQDAYFIPTYFEASVIQIWNNGMKVYILFIHQQMHFLLNIEKFKFTWKYT